MLKRWCQWLYFKNASRKIAGNHLELVDVAAPRAARLHKKLVAFQNKKSEKNPN